MERYSVCPFVPPDQIGFSKSLWQGDDCEEAAAVIQQLLSKYPDGLVLVDREHGDCMFWRLP